MSSWCHLFLTFYHILTKISDVDSIQSRDGIAVYTYDEVLAMHARGIEYLGRPLIITDSSQSQWTLLEHLHEIYTDEFTIDAVQQTTNCSCLAHTSLYSQSFEDMAINDLCEHFAAALLYQSPGQHYEYWQRFEGRHKATREGEDCVHIEQSKMNLHRAFQELAFIEQNPSYSYTDIEHIEKRNESNSDRSEISKFRSYFNAFSFRGEFEEIDAVQLNTLDHIRLAPFFTIFDMNGFSDVNTLHIWFATEYYRAIRHYDKSDNIFFVLKGSRHFRISKPNINVFEMYPYNHASGRHTYPNYPMLEQYREGVEVPNEYKIHEVTVYENEVLYLPHYWYHEVINDNITVALSIWSDSVDGDLGLFLYDMHVAFRRIYAITFLCFDRIKGDEMMEIELPITLTHPDDTENPALEYDVIHKHGVDGFFYFIQIVTEQWCEYIRGHEQRNEYSLRCMNAEFDGYGFLLDNFRAIWRIVDEVSFDNFEWNAMIIDMDNILKCTKHRVVDYADLSDFKQHLYICSDFEEKYKTSWQESAAELIEILKKHSNIGAAEANLVEYLEDILLTVTAESNVLPIWVKLMRL